MPIVSANSWTETSGVNSSAPSKNTGDYVQKVPWYATTIGEILRTHYLERHRRLSMKSEIVRGIQIELHTKSNIKSTRSNEVPRVRSAPERGITRRPFTAASVPINDLRKNVYYRNTMCSVERVKFQAPSVSYSDLQQTLTCQGIRSKSAPPFARSQNSTFRQRPIFWNTRNTNHLGISKTATLRSLLYDPESERVRQCKDCPYKCRGCFKACLASDDYFRRVLNSRQ